MHQCTFFFLIQSVCRFVSNLFLWWTSLNPTWSGVEARWFWHAKISTFMPDILDWSQSIFCPPVFCIKNIFALHDGYFFTQTDIVLLTWINTLYLTYNHWNPHVQTKSKTFFKNNFIHSILTVWGLICRQKLSCH